MLLQVILSLPENKISFFLFIHFFNEKIYKLYKLYLYIRKELIIEF